MSRLNIISFVGSAEFNRAEFVKKYPIATYLEEHPGPGDTLLVRQLYQAGFRDLETFGKTPIKIIREILTESFPMVGPARLSKLYELYGKNLEFLAKNSSSLD